MATALWQRTPDFPCYSKASNAAMLEEGSGFRKLGFTWSQGPPWDHTRREAPASMRRITFSERVRSLAVRRFEGPSERDV